MKTSDALEALAFAYGYGLGGLEPCPDDRVPGDVVREWLSELIRKEREEAWKEGHHEGLDTGLTIAEFVHENGGTLRLSDVPKPKENPYRKEKQ